MNEAPFSLALHAAEVDWIFTIVFIRGIAFGLAASSLCSRPLRCEVLSDALWPAQIPSEVKSCVYLRVQNFETRFVFDKFDKNDVFDLHVILSFKVVMIFNDFLFVNFDLNPYFTIRHAS